LWNPEHSGYFDKEKYILPLPGIVLNKITFFPHSPYLALLQNYEPSYKKMV
jgi:hypothetical protein